MNPQFNRSSFRVVRARAAILLGKKWLGIIAAIIAIASLICGAALIVLGEAAGWLAFLPAAWIAVPLFWYRGDLMHIKTGKYIDPQGVLLHEALEVNTLVPLGKNKNPQWSAYDIWKALENSNERFFFNNRYLVTSDFFEAFVSKQPGSDQIVWQKAQELQTKHQTDGYRNSILIVALISTVPDVDSILNSIQLELSDIETGISWLSDAERKRELALSKKNFGGIGRDWAYGYTPLLRSLGHNITQGIEQYGFFSDTHMHQPIVQQMAQVLSSNNTITLVGEEGVGKTTCVYALAESMLADKSLAKNIRYNQIIELDASTLIANAKRPGELEDLMIHILNEAHRAKNITLFFDEAHVFFGASTGTVDLSHVLQPVFESGSVRIILAMNPQHWQQLSRTGVAARLKPITVPSADQDNTIAVLRDQVGTLEYKHKTTFTYPALQEAFKLGSRYVTNQAMPGAALSILQQTASTVSAPLVTREVVQQAVEQAYGIKLQTADNYESSSLLNLEDELQKQVISQQRAISVIANALRRSRSGVGNPDRPIGTFLFLGPTGVGKTELSKALARSYFSDENALIRVDMNQYVAAEDVSRLIAPQQGTELGFLGSVRTKPFSVILFDEIEKAHPSVINALLQMLDEGIMRDSDNRPVSFRDAIIIATSNAGADEIRRLIDAGQRIEDMESTFVDTLISRGNFAPEFVNRFDEVVLFKPLSQEELVSVIDLILAGINSTLSVQKVRVELTEPAKRWLVAKGYDSKLGARPMRRMAQRYVENIVAKKLLERSVVAGGVVQLDVVDFESTLA